jgi:prepilin-type N-terminal cleavage/methylation domain-containing protein
MKQEARGRWITGTDSPEPVAGFSLIELMMALTITLIVSGAIYGLMTVGSNAFNREPEIADQQQAIRVAMDLIAKDVLVAGDGVPTLTPVFTVSDDTGGDCTAGLNGCGATGAIGTEERAGVSDLEQTDVLEILSSDGACPALRVCAGNGAQVGKLVTREAVPTCLRDALPGFGLISNATLFAIQPMVSLPDDDASSPDKCPSGTTEAKNGFLMATANGVGKWKNGGTAILSTSELYLYGAEIIRYRVARSSDPSDPIPKLWRSTTGRFEADGTPTDDPGTASFASGGSVWQMVADGIDDLQIEYFSGLASDANKPAWSNAAPVQTSFDTIVQQVRVTLSARVTANQALAGATGPGAGGAGANAIRGRLTSVICPRRNIAALQLEGKVH